MRVLRHILFFLASFCAGMPLQQSGGLHYAEARLSFISWEDCAAFHGDNKVVRSYVEVLKRKLKVRYRESHVRLDLCGAGLYEFPVILWNRLVFIQRSYLLGSCTLGATSVRGPPFFG